MKNILLIIILSLTAFSLALPFRVLAQSSTPQATSSPVEYGKCGDSVCDAGENSPASTYYCPQDCYLAGHWPVILTVGLILAFIALAAVIIVAVLIMYY